MFVCSLTIGLRSLALDQNPTTDHSGQPQGITKALPALLMVDTAQKCTECLEGASVQDPASQPRHTNTRPPACWALGPCIHRLPLTKTFLQCLCLDPLTSKDLKTPFSTKTPSSAFFLISSPILPLLQTSTIPQDHKMAEFCAHGSGQLF